MKFQVKDKRVILIDRTMRLVGDNEYEFLFEFDEEWEGKVKTARFVMGDYMKDIVLNNDKCLIEKTFFKGGKLKVGVYASNVATTVLTQTFKPSILEESGGEPTVPENLWTQLLEIIDADVQSVRQATSYAQDIVDGFGDVAKSKQEEFNTYAAEKQTEFNQNAADKIREYNEHVIEYTTEINSLKSDLTDHKNDTTKHITGAERTKWNKNTTDIVALNEALANMQGTVVDSVEEMTDTSKQYVLKSTGTIWKYKETTTEKEVTITDELDDTTYYDESRLGNSGTNLTDGFSDGAIGYHITPLIDLTKAEYVGKTINLHLEGAHYISETNETWIQNRAYAPNGAVLFGRSYSNPTDPTYLGAVHIKSYTIESNTSAVLTLTPPVTYGAGAVEIGYFRFCGKGAVADSHIYITYEDMRTVTESAWVDTGVAFGSGGGGVDAETLAKISELNNEGADPTTIKLLAQPVLDFYNASAYSDNDYTYSHLSKKTYPCRADIPVPYTVKWNYNENAMRTTVAVDTRAIGVVNAHTLKTYDATGLNKLPLYNLLPNTRYYYKVTHVMADGSLVEAKSGNFLTSSETVRLLYIDGTQNVRDLGGWTGLNGKKVKYGKIIRGASLSDSSASGLIVTGKGRLSLAELKIQAELNLGAIDNATSIASNCAYKKIGYTNYAIAITGETYRAQFKEVLEWIVSCLDGTLNVSGLYTVQRNIYFHCQGGCDRTGTLSFQLLGLLGVSESDLAKEYELSSFSDVGFGRLRTTTKAVDTYDYVGMVEALKTYSGDT